MLFYRDKLCYTIDMVVIRYYSYYGIIYNNVMRNFNNKYLDNNEV
jgi:hypothetical protein